MSPSWKKRQTFDELAIGQKPVKVPRLYRAPLEYWTSFEGAWLRGPIEKVHSRALEMESRQAIKNMAIRQAQGKAPKGHLGGSFVRGCLLYTSDAADE